MGLALYRAELVKFKGYNRGPFWISDDFVKDRAFSASTTPSNGSDRIRRPLRECAEGLY